MRTEFMGENPTLTALFGDEAENDIRAVAAETGLPVETVRNAVIEFAPELLGEDTKASNVVGVANAVSSGLSSLIPNIMAAAKGQPATTATQPAAPDYTKLLIPAAIAGVLLFILMKK